MRREAIFLLLLLFASHAQVTAGGGNVTELVFLQSNFSNAWGGLYGQVVLGTGANISYVVVGGAVTQVDLIAQEPPCPVASRSVHVIAVNATSLTAPLQPGDLAVLDGILTGADNGTASFTQNGSFGLSYGNFSDVPTLFTLANGTTSAYFREGYFNDALGNLVFVADVVSDKPDWNGSTSDYQMILPKSGANYTLSVDFIYTCTLPNPNPNPNPSPNTHRLYILPPQMFTALAGSAFDAGFVVRNTGGFTENGINVTISCPAGFSCGSGYIPYLNAGGEGSVPIPMTTGGTGEFVLTVCAKDADTSMCREFVVSVTAQCNGSNGCGAGSFCQNSVCETKKKPGGSCNGSNQCLSGVCSGGMCGYCAVDSDCPVDQACSSGACVNVKCACGKVSGHACVSYACCADTDCGRCQICSGNSCLDKRFDILVVGAQEGMVEGQVVRVRVLGNDGRGVSEAMVFTNDMQSYTDANGYASITVTYDGIVYASADCYQTTGRMFNIVKNAIVVVPPNVSVGETSPIIVLDSHGRPIASATVYVEDTPAITDSYGVIYHTFTSSGVKTILVQATGYRTIIASALVVNGFSCGYPSIAGFLVPGITSVWRLWFILSLIAIANFFLLRRIMKETAEEWPIASTLLQLAYAAVPLYIAYMWFSLCFMSDIVVLQFVAGLLIVAGNTFIGLGTIKEDGKLKKK